jgi:hypothetical protein
MTKDIHVYDRPDDIIHVYDRPDDIIHICDRSDDKHVCEVDEHFHSACHER